MTWNRFDYEVWYCRISSKIRSIPKGGKWVSRLNMGVTALIYFAYLISAAYLAFSKNPGFWKIILVPGVSFVLVSVFRRWYNAPRPYELYSIDPLIVKDKKGQSFPSRHVFSAFVIAVTIMAFHPGIGLAAFFLGSALAVLRVVGGVHFPKDVIWGAVIGILSGIIGIWGFRNL